MSKAPAPETAREYPYRCKCGRAAFVQTGPGVYLCRKCLCAREHKEYLPDVNELDDARRDNPAGLLPAGGFVR